MPILGTDANDLLEGLPGADDIIYGGDGDDTLRGGQGDDVLEGGAGADEIDGGEDGGLPLSPTTVRGSIWGDTATYVHSDAGVTIDLAMGTAQGGHAEGDTLTGIESIRGSDHADMLVARNDDPATEATEAGLVEGSTLKGQRGDDTLSGGTGVDRLWGGKGDDVLMGGAGDDDYLEGGVGADVLDGGDGVDWVGYELSDAGVTIDLATGTAQGGHAEGDTLTGIEFIFGSSYADRLTGDAEFNALLGGPGADMLDGGEGFDWAGYYTSDAGVTVNLATGTGEGGHAEGDTLTGIVHVSGSFLHADHITGDDEANSLRGLGGNDTLEGGAGNDSLRGGPGADTLDGGAGNDWLDGGAGADLLTGGEDADTFVFGDGDTVTDFQDGSDLIDIQDFGHINTDNFDTNVTIRQSGDDVEVQIGDAVLTLTGVSAADVTADDFILTGIENIDGSDHAERLIGDAGDNRLNGGGGDDTLEGGAGNDDLHGDDGNDDLHGGDGDDNLEGGDGSDNLHGDDGNDDLHGGAWADRLDGGAGDDTAAYWDSDAGVTVNLTRSRGQRGGDAEGDTLTGIENIDGSSHADLLIGNGRNNALDGRDGNDTLISGAGDDRLHGGAGADRLDGGEGHDDWALHWGSDAGVTVNLATGTGQGGHAEGDTLTGIESIHGSEHADHLTGDDGDNGFNGDAGADTIDGGEGHDFAGYWGSDAGVTVNLATGTGQGGHAEGDTLTDIESIHGSDHADHLIGSDEDDSLNGEAGADTLDGGEGHGDWVGYWGSDAGVTVNLVTGTGQGGHAEGDTLTGIEGINGSHYHADHLIGDDGDNGLSGEGGDDTLEGGGGDDWLDGQAGEDLLTGGEGADTFVFGDGDTVTDFQDGSDLIDIQDFGHINADNFETNVTLRQSGDDVEVQIGDGVLTLTGVSAADVTADDFVLA